MGDNYLLLDKPGQNGWLGLITCLKWWRVGLNSLEDPDQQALLELDWYQAVEDMTKMLQGLVARRTSASLTL
jgi:hypothetical protein